MAVILDRHGRPIERPPATRLALGFITRELHVDEPPSIGLPGVTGSREPEESWNGHGDEQDTWG